MDKPSSFSDWGATDWTVTTSSSIGEYKPGKIDPVEYQPLDNKPIEVPNHLNSVGIVLVGLLALSVASLFVFWLI